MNYKETVKAGYNAIAKRYLAERTRDSEDVVLIRNLIESLPDDATVLDAGCGAGIPIAQILSWRFKVTGVDFQKCRSSWRRKMCQMELLFARI